MGGVDVFFICGERFFVVVVAVETVVRSIGVVIARVHGGARMDHGQLGGNREIVQWMGSDIV